MPAISDIPVRLSAEEISHAWETRRGRPLAPAMLKNLQELLQKIESNDWLDMAIHYRILKVTEYGPDWLALGEFKLNSAMVTQHLHRATYLVFGVCTLGQRPVQQIRDWFAEKKHLQAVLLDEIGTLLLYKTSDYFELLMCEQAKSMGLQASGSFNPGDDGFDISLQGTVLELAGGRDIGVTLQGSGTLTPHKSLTSVIGLGRGMPMRSRADRCRDCQSRERCPHSQTLRTEFVQ